MQDNLRKNFKFGPYPQKIYQITNPPIHTLIKKLSVIIQVNFFEDETKLKIPSEITPPLTQFMLWELIRKGQKSRTIEQGVNEMDKDAKKEIGTQRLSVIALKVKRTSHEQ